MKFFCMIAIGICTHVHAVNSYVQKNGRLSVPVDAARAKRAAILHPFNTINGLVTFIAQYHYHDQKYYNSLKTRIEPIAKKSKEKGFLATQNQVLPRRLSGDWSLHGFVLKTTYNKPVSPLTLGAPCVYIGFAHSLNIVVDMVRASDPDLFKRVVKNQSQPAKTTTAADATLEEFKKITKLKTDDDKLRYMQQNPHLLTQETVNTPITDLREAALHISAKLFQSGLVTKLLDTKAQVNAQDICGNTPLHAVAEQDEDSIEKPLMHDTAYTLLQYNANPAITNTDSKTVLHVAQKWSNQTIINLLSLINNTAQSPQGVQEPQEQKYPM